MTKNILEVVVGSRLHNLYNEQSDFDYRGIFMHPVTDLISPFKKIKNTSWIEGDIDNTAYELRDFCKLATHGNPTILEILWSNQIKETSPLGEELRTNKQKFLDSRRIFEAHKGYAHNQYTKMNLFEADVRTPKFAIAYIRSIHQAIQLLVNGDFTPQVHEPLRSYLMDVKYNFHSELIPDLGKMFSELQTELAEAYYANATKFKPDIDWIEKFLNRAY